MFIITCSLNTIILAEETPDQPSVSTVFFQTDIRDALNEVSMQTGVNIIFDRIVQGKVTLDLKDVPLEKALKMLCISGGYTYQKIDDFYIVGLPDPNSPTFQHLTKTETIKLNYLTASEARGLLPPFYSDFIKTSSSRENIITITAPETVIKKFKKDLDKIDLPEKQVLIKMLVTEISTEVLEESGSNFLELFTGTGSGNLSYYDYMEESAEEDHFLGIGETITLATDTSYGQLLTQLRALEKEEKAEIEANPRVRVSDRATAELFIGEERSFLLQTSEDESSLETVDVGISLKVTPEILNEDELRLKVAPDISHFTHETENDIVIRSSELSSTVYAKNGEMLTLAGITLDERVEYKSQVPLLGDIPLVRLLFRRQTEKKGERELLIFIIPEIVGGE
jgi:type IV pilus assembly protein PilQ